MNKKPKIKALRKLILPLLVVLFLYFIFMTVYFHSSRDNIRRSENIDAAENHL